MVFEKFAEMNNKYDVGNFAKILDEYSTEAEMESIQSFIFKKNPEFKTPDGPTSKFDFVKYESKQLNF